MSQNEWKTTEIRASKVGNFSPFSCPGLHPRGPSSTVGTFSMRRQKDAVRLYTIDVQIQIEKDPESPKLGLVWDLS